MALLRGLEHRSLRGSGTVDGVRARRSSVPWAQSGLVVDGIVGRKTVAALMA